jgi:biotin operon repressor
MKSLGVIFAHSHGMLNSPIGEEYYLVIGCEDTDSCAVAHVGELTYTQYRLLCKKLSQEFAQGSCFATTFTIHRILSLSCARDILLVEPFASLEEISAISHFGRDIREILLIQRWLHTFVKPEGLDPEEVLLEFKCCLRKQTFTRDHLVMLSKAVQEANHIREADGCGNKNIENIYAVMLANTADIEPTGALTAKVESKTVATRLERLIAKKPYLAERSAAYLAERLRCSEAAIKCTAVWKSIRALRRKEKRIYRVDADHPRLLQAPTGVGVPDDIIVGDNHSEIGDTVGNPLRVKDEQLTEVVSVLKEIRDAGKGTIAGSVGVPDTDKAAIEKVVERQAKATEKQTKELKKQTAILENLGESAGKSTAK